MRVLTIVAAVVALAAAALAIGSTQAKGPVRIEVSGGDLSEPVVLTNGFDPDWLFPLAEGDYMDAPLPYPERMYTISATPEMPDGATGEYPVLFTRTYYPAHDGLPAALRDEDGNFIPVRTGFQRLLDEAGIGGQTVSSGGDGGSLAWYLAPALALGLVAVSGGLLGMRSRRRRVV